MYHAWLFDFLDGLGGGNDPLNFQNRAIAGFWENARFIRSNGRKTTFEWPKVVSEVIFPRFWGVVCIEKCFRNFEILIRSAVSEMSRFTRICANTRKTRHLRNGTSDQNFKIPKTLFNTNYPPKPRKNHLRNHFRPLESGFSAIATYKTRIFSKSCNGPILKI